MQEILYGDFTEIVSRFHQHLGISVNYLTNLQDIH